MRVRRRFQPTLDSLPLRIAPSTSGGVGIVVQCPAPSSTGPIRVTMGVDDTDSPESTGSTPIIIAPTINPTTIA